MLIRHRTSYSKADPKGGSAAYENKRILSARGQLHGTACGPAGIFDTRRAAAGAGRGTHSGSCRTAVHRRARPAVRPRHRAGHPAARVLCARRGGGRHARDCHPVACRQAHLLRRHRYRREHGPAHGVAVAHHRSAEGAGPAARFPPSGRRDSGARDASGAVRRIRGRRLRRAVAHRHRKSVRVAHLPPERPIDRRAVHSGGCPHRGAGKPANLTHPPRAARHLGAERGAVLRR